MLPGLNSVLRLGKARKLLPYEGLWAELFPIEQD